MAIPPTQLSETTTERPPFPPALMQRVGFLLSMTKGGAEVICGEALAPLDLHVKQLGLLTVLATEGPHSQQSLASWTRLDRTTMVALVDSLEARGHVKRKRNPDDRRAYLVQITPSGRDAQRAGERAIRKAEKKLLAALTAEERDQLLALLGKVAAAVGRQPSGPRPIPAG